MSRSGSNGGELKQIIIICKIVIGDFLAYLLFPLYYRRDRTFL